MSDETQTKKPANRPVPGPGPDQPAIRVSLMPKDTNAFGTIFGGIILSYIDQAGAVPTSAWASASSAAVDLQVSASHGTLTKG